MKILNTGVQSPNGQIEIVDQDRLCYLVKNVSRSSVGVRTISKAIVEEFVGYLRNHINATPRELRESLSGSSNIDKYEYGYESTISAIANLILDNENNLDFVHEENEKSLPVALSLPLQQIYYGAPGTGKSFTINKVTKRVKANTIRTTFHPDTDYASFVGAYKPTTKEVVMRDLSGCKILDDNKTPLTEEKIVYEFVSQSFLKAYVNAWKLYAKAETMEEVQNQYLIIEEINRGNCAQIFGDLFQLLDRNKYGFSDYPIEADADMQKQLRKQFEGLDFPLRDSVNGLYDDEDRDIVSEVLEGKILLLPNNLYIWATMNTSDQSLFPIDSAFKRRWDWKYMPISDAGKNWTILANKNYYSWWEFLQKINALIYEATSSEDKKLGYFFCKPKDDKCIDAETFVGKVIFYLWNDVFKDYDLSDSAFYENDTENPLTFDKFYMAVGHHESIVDEEIVDTFLKNLGLTPIEVDVETKTEKNYYSDGYIFKRIKVVLDGEEIYEETSIDTFIKTIEKIGLDKVANLGLKVSSYDLLSKTPLDENTAGGYGKAQRNLGEYWLVTKYATSAKINYLKKIQKALNLNLEVTTA